MNREEWPEHITAIRAFTYDVETVYQNLLSDNRSEDGEIEIVFEDVMEAIENYAANDLSCGFGHEIRLKDIIFQDENGNEQ